MKASQTETFTGQFGQSDSVSLSSKINISGGIMKRTLGQMLMLVLVVGLVGCGDAGFVVQSSQSEIGALTPESETIGTDSDGATTGGDSGESGTFRIECNADRSECAYQKMPLYSQTDGRLPNSLRMTATGNNLCAPTSLTMLLDTLMSYSNIKFKSSGLFETRFRDRDVFKEQIPNMVDLMQAGMASDTIAANGSNGGHFDNFLAGYAEVDGAEPVALSAMRTDSVYPGSQFKFKKTTFSFDVIKSLLDQKNILVVSVCLGCSKKCSVETGKCTFAGVGHAIAVRGYNERDKKILLNDPNGMQTAFPIEKIDLGDDQSKWLFNDITSTYSIGRTKNIVTGEAMYNVIMEMYGYKLP